MDILSLMGSIQLILFLFYIETITIRWGKKVTRWRILTYILVWFLILYILTMAIQWYFLNEVFILIALSDAILSAIAFLIIDVFAFLLARALYRRFPKIGYQLGHPALKEKWRKKRLKKLGITQEATEDEIKEPIEQKHKSRKEVKK